MRPPGNTLLKLPMPTAIIWASTEGQPLTWGKRGSAVDGNDKRLTPEIVEAGTHQHASEATGRMPAAWVAGAEDLWRPFEQIRCLR